jgi:hypothetical protein
VQVPAGILAELPDGGLLRPTDKLAEDLEKKGITLASLPQITLQPFRAPAVWFTCIMGIVVCLAQMIGLPRETWERLIIWMGIGIVIYFTYGFWNSKLRQPTPQQAGGPTA